MSIIIPVCNNWELTEACLRSLREHAPDGGFEVIAVDNASQDATAARLAPLGQALFPGRFTALRNAENRNFSGACNQGARTARHGLLFFLNNDTLLTPGWAAPLRRALAEDASLAAAGPLLTYADDTVQHLGAAVYPDRSIHHFYAGIPAAHPLAQKRRALNFITAAALLIGKDAFFAAGAFHEGYVNGLEDVELCYRLRRAGRTLAVIPESRVYHLEGATRNGTPAPPRNAPLLRERCPDLRRPEFHRIALADGYRPGFGLFFETFLEPAPERLERYAREGVTADEAALVNILHSEIFWKDGYLALAALREQAGETESALAALVACSRQYPEIEVLEKTRQLAERTGRANLAGEYAGLLALARNTLRDANFFRIRYRTITETAAALADAELAKMARGWRKAYGKTMPEVFV